uniref:Enoyl-CoA hydratase n=1 Tax=Alexandrium monilatum TaxID=311494 RepID=A0A7S4V0H0_9DINO
MATKPPPVLYECRDGVALITLNRPERMNGWNGELGEAWLDAYDQAVADAECRVIVVVGSGRAWCAGADMGMLQGLSSAGGIKREGSSSREADPVVTGKVVDSKGRWINHAQTLPKPVIACINGAVGGGGFSQAMSCDVRFAASDVNFSSAFARRGLIAEWGISWTLPNAIGTGAAMDVLLSARKFTSEEALQMGIVQRIYPKEKLLEETLAYARDVARNVPPASLAVIKQQVLRHPRMPVHEALTETNRLMVQSTKLPNFREGVQSYVGKRAPNFPAFDPSDKLVTLMGEMQRSKL